MGKPEATDSNHPSAPPPEDIGSSSGHAGPQLQTVAPLHAPAPVMNTSDNSPPPSYGSTNAPVPNVTDGVPPPPSYQEAVAYPAPSYQPNTFPKPANSMPPQPNAHIYPAYPSQPSGVGSPYMMHAPQFPASPQPTGPVHTTTTIITPGGNCPHCAIGQVQNETDLCCLLCLIILAIFTFPVGLVLLCCIPCTVRQRCTRCRRLT
jgi:hypothetical protein